MILSSLKNGALREEIEAQGGIKLVYIDPPFDVGADFSMNIEIPSSLPPTHISPKEPPPQSTPEGTSPLSGGLSADSPLTRGLGG